MKDIQNIQVIIGHRRINTKKQMQIKFSMLAQKGQKHDAH